MREEDPDLPMLRHTIATLAYRAAKAVRGAPEGFASFRAGADGRTALERFDARLAAGAPLANPATKVFAGPVADALTHTGQIAMLRRMAGAKIRGESYFRADVVAGRVGLEQASPRREFD